MWYTSFMAKKILIIDDDYNGSKAIKEILKKEGFEVFYAYSGDEGLKKINETKPDLILLDLVLTDTSGFKIAQELKENPKYSDIAIIAISLKKEDIDKHVAMKVGIIDYLEKPIDAGKLIFKIKGALNI